MRSTPPRRPGVGTKLTENAAEQAKPKGDGLPGLDESPSGQKTQRKVSAEVATGAKQTEITDAPEAATESDRPA
jgi:hypothetical protein